MGPSPPVSAAMRCAWASSARAQRAHAGAAHGAAAFLLASDQRSLAKDSSSRAALAEHGLLNIASASHARARRGDHRAAGSDYWPPAANGDVLVLSRFAYMRRRGNDLVLGSPRAARCSRFAIRRCSLLATLSAAQESGGCVSGPVFPARAARFSSIATFSSRSILLGGATRGGAESRLGLSRSVISRAQHARPPRQSLGVHHYADTARRCRRYAALAEEDRSAQASRRGRRRARACCATSACSSSHGDGAAARTSANAPRVVAARAP